jgi:hypothetical protein
VKDDTKDGTPDIPRRRIVFDVPPDATDEELDRFTEVVVREMDQQAAEHYRKKTLMVIEANDC